MSNEQSSVDGKQTHHGDDERVDLPAAAEAPEQSMTQVWERQEDIQINHPHLDLMDSWSSDGDAYSSTSSADSDNAEDFVYSQNAEPTEAIEEKRNPGVRCLRNAGVYTGEELIDQAIDRWETYSRLCSRSLDIVRQQLIDAYVPFAIEQHRQQREEQSKVKPVSSVSDSAREEESPSAKRRRQALRNMLRPSAKTANQRHVACVSKFAIVSHRLAKWRKQLASRQCRYRDPTTTTWEKPCFNQCLPSLPVCALHLVALNPAPSSGYPISESMNNRLPSVSTLEPQGETTDDCHSSSSSSSFRTDSGPKGTGEKSNFKLPWQVGSKSTSSSNVAGSSASTAGIMPQLQTQMSPSSTIHAKPFPDVFIVAARRSPIGRLSGSLSGLAAHEIGAQVIASLFDRGGSLNGDCESSVESEIAPKLAEVIVGQVLQTCAGQNPARQAAVLAGIPVTVPAWSVNMVCGSGLKAIALGYDRLRASPDGSQAWLIAGGMESMSQAPHACPPKASLRRGAKQNASELNPVGDFRLLDTLLKDGLMDAFNGIHMGITAENIAKRYGVSRQDQDQFAVESQQKYQRALQNGCFSQEITPINISNGKNEATDVDKDEHPRPDVTSSSLARMKPVFLPDPSLGTVTAGNATGLNDGAAFVLLCRSSEADFPSRLKPLARIAGWHQVGLDPTVMGMGPVGAIKGLLTDLCWPIDSVALYEINEAFAAQAVACSKELNLPTDRVNVQGGAIALGHPLGCSGARVIVTLVHALRRCRAEHESGSLTGAATPLRGIAAMCVGGGMGIAMGIELSVGMELNNTNRFDSPSTEYVFIQRDFSEGTGVRFETTIPQQLRNRMSPNQFSESIKRLNNLFDEAEEISSSVCLENCLGCLTAYLIFMCMQTHYEKVLKRVTQTVKELNERVFIPADVLMIDPSERGLRVIQLCILPRS